MTTPGACAPSGHQLCSPATCEVRDCRNSPAQPVEARGYSSDQHQCPQSRLSCRCSGSPSQVTTPPCLALVSSGPSCPHCRAQDSSLCAPTNVGPGVSVQQCWRREATWAQQGRISQSHAGCSVNGTRPGIDTSPHPQGPQLLAHCRFTMPLLPMDTHAVPRSVRTP